MMPSTKREQIKDRHDRAMKACDKALVYVDELYELFKDVHPAYATGYSAICQMLVTTRESIAKLRTFI